MSDVSSLAVDAVVDAAFARRRAAHRDRLSPPRGRGDVTPRWCSARPFGTPCAALGPRRDRRRPRQRWKRCERISAACHFQPPRMRSSDSSARWPGAALAARRREAPGQDPAKAAGCRRRRSGRRAAPCSRSRRAPGRPGADRLRARAELEDAADAEPLCCLVQAPAQAVELSRVLYRMRNSPPRALCSIVTRKPSTSSSARSSARVSGSFSAFGAPACLAASRHCRVVLGDLLDLADAQALLDDPLRHRLGITDRQQGAGMAGRELAVADDSVLHGSRAASAAAACWRYGCGSCR